MHKETCLESNDDYYCSKIGSIGYGNTITYGNTTTTEGVLNTGDAFDCDVDGTGYNRRFYYVSDLYTGTESGVDQFDENTAVLIYSNNVTITNDTKLNDTYWGSIAYEEEGTNYKGPLTAMRYIPNKSLWTNMSIKENRQIRNENGGTSTAGGTITFSGYTEKAARLLTTQEINKGCGLTSSTMLADGALDTNKCRFLLETTKYGNGTSIDGYWLETPISTNAWNQRRVYGQGRNIDDGSVSIPFSYGVRPAIEVAKSNIEY